MAAMSTALTVFSTLGDTRTYYVTASHTVIKPKLILQKRKVPQGGQTMAEQALSVVYATDDAAGAVLPQKISIVATARVPADRQDDVELDLAIALFRDMVASDEFVSAIKTLGYLKP